MAQIDPFKPPAGSKAAVFYFLLWKRYFDTGLALTVYVKWFIAFFGFASRNVNTTMIFAVAYAIFCFVLGWWWHKYNFVRLEIEISNRFNDFVSEMREKINGENK